MQPVLGVDQFSTGVSLGERSKNSYGYMLMHSVPGKDTAFYPNKIGKNWPRTSAPSMQMSHALKKQIPNDEVRCLSTSSELLANDVGFLRIKMCTLMKPVLTHQELHLVSFAQYLLSFLRRNLCGSDCSTPHWRIWLVDCSPTLWPQDSLWLFKSEKVGQKSFFEWVLCSRPIFIRFWSGAMSLPGCLIQHIHGKFLTELPLQEGS